MMHTRLAKAIALAIPLTMLAGCSNNDSNDDNNSGTVPIPSNGPVVSFDPGNGIVPYPSDLFGFDDDGTLIIPGESEWNIASHSETPNAYWNYMGTQDGWGTSIPIIINLEMPESDTDTPVTVDETTLINGVNLFSVNEQGALEPLVWNEDFRAIIGPGGTLNIEPLKPFKEQTHYYLALTTAIKDSNNEAIQPSSSYLELLEGNDPTATHLQQVHNTLAAHGISSNSIAYSADFTTTSVFNILRPVASSYLQDFGQVHFNETTEEARQANNNNFTSQQLVRSALAPHLSSEAINSDTSLSGSEESNYRIIRTTIDLPYFLDSPEYGKNCDYYPGMASGTAPDNMNEYLINPGKFCSGAFSFWQSGVEQPSGLPITPQTADTLHVFDENNTIDVLITIPKDESKRDPEKGFKTFIYIHGFNMDKESALGMADIMAQHGYAIVAIDHPVHGSRSVDINGDGHFEINATGNGMDFAMPNNVLTTKSHMYQTFVDQLGLRLAIANGINDQTGPLLNNDEVHLTGISLGGIVSTSVSSLLRETQEHHPDFSQQLDLKTTALSVPGAGLASIMLYSPMISPMVEDIMKPGAAFRLYLAEQLDFYNPLQDIASPQKLDALNQLDAYEQALPEGSQEQEDYEQLVEQSWNTFSSMAELTIQSVLDPIDPVNHATILAQHQEEPVFLFEAVGDGSNELDIPKLMLALASERVEWNPGDFVIPNQIPYRPQAGTDALIRALGLPVLEGGHYSNSVMRGAGRYGYGTHGSSQGFVDTGRPNILPYDKDVHDSVTTAIISSAESHGRSVTVPGDAQDGQSILLDQEQFPARPAYAEN